MQDMQKYVRYAIHVRYAKMQKKMHNLLFFVEDNSSSLTIAPADPQCMCC